MSSKRPTKTSAKGPAKKGRGSEKCNTDAESPPVHVPNTSLPVCLGSEEHCF